MKRAKVRFYLHKWFLDAVSNEGETLIFYAGELHWHRFKALYTSKLHYQPGHTPVSSARFFRVNFPTEEAGIIRWKDARFGADGVWEARDEPLQARLYDNTEAGYLDWHCHQPASRVRLQLKDRVFTGLGYVEHLTLAIEPWHIPMDQLRWGRYISERDCLVWIEWRQRGRRQWVWYNGAPVSGARIEDDVLELPDQQIRLTLDRSAVLEAENKIGQVVKSLVRFLPGVQTYTPAHFLTAAETKWRSRGILFKNDQPYSNGWAIHELVDFTPPPL